MIDRDHNLRELLRIETDRATRAERQFSVERNDRMRAERELRWSEEERTRLAKEVRDLKRVLSPAPVGHLAKILRSVLG